MQTVIKDLPRNEKMDSNDMAAIEGGITFPSLLHGAPIKLIAPPQPVTQPSLDEVPSETVTLAFTSIAYKY